MANLNEFNSWLLSLNPFGLTKNEEIKSKLEAQKIEVFDFTLGDPKEPTPSFIKKALIENIDDISQYPSNMGSALLRKSCSNWAKKRLAIELNPDTNSLYSPSTNFLRGCCKSNINDYLGAIEDFTKSIELNYNVEECYYRRAIAKSSLKDHASAISDLTKAVELNSNKRN